MSFIAPGSSGDGSRDVGRRAQRTLLLVDNYDSFTHNLAHAFSVLGPTVRIVANDHVTPTEVLARPPDYLVLSAGPRAPRDAGASLRLARELAGVIPLLGVCLGHQCIAEAFGIETVRAGQPVHGKTSRIWHEGRGLFEGMPAGFRAARYHSLIVPRVPEQFEVLAWTEQREIMAIGHQQLPIWGVQFHPESFLTEHGARLLDNFLQLAHPMGRGT